MHRTFISDNDVQRICLEFDSQWLVKEVEGGSCATFIIVTATVEGKRLVQRVCNIGDSHVLLARCGNVADAMTTLPAL